ncbi:cytochrome P450 [Melanogaster broomeanus]|nr:cytochrome P450 [Melanogaster broomeanus]
MSVSLRDSLFPLLLLLIAARYVAKRSSGASTFPLPPGPKGLPFLGTALSIDATKPGSLTANGVHHSVRMLILTILLTNLTETIAGDLVHTHILYMDVLIINSAKVARDLLELRSNIYSDRPYLATVIPYGIESGTVFMPYGGRWRLQRRIYHQAFNTKAALDYRPIQLRKARQMVVNLVDDPKRFAAHLFTFSTSVIMMILYGHDSAPTNDPFVEFAEKGMDAIVKAARPETAALLNIFPFLLKLPTWMPGSFKAEASVSKRYADEFREAPFDMVKKKMAAGTDIPCVMTDAIRRNESDGNLPEVTDAIISIAPVTYGTAAETTAFTLQVFVLTMVLFPEAQRKAQKDIDAVVGSHRLPNFDDRPALPYVDALIREVLRWHPVGPTGSDVYEGMHIPKGATVFVNTWAMAHNEETYPAPFKFTPERFLKEDGTLTEDDCSFAFGFGRRFCPGRYLADASLWISVASMLASLDFSKEKDDQGNDIDFEPKFTAEVTSRPEPFPCRIVPRRSASEAKEIGYAGH